MSYVSLAGISKSFGDTLAVKSIDLTVERGEFFSLLGPSGCGKTTTLRMIAGFVKPSSGVIMIHDCEVTGLPPEARDIGIVFQNYAIFPHLSVFDNIAFGLRMRKQSENEIARKVEGALDQVGMAGYGGRYERELSGGQKQRVALARVLVIEPEILLLDEPLSALDKKMREEMKIWIKDIQRTVGITTIYVTHDQGEALVMSDRIAVMDQGEVLQVGSPTDIYERPANRFVTGFIGDSNILNGSVEAVDGGTVRLAIEGVEVQAAARDGLRVGQRVAIVVRPEHLLLGQAAEQPGYNCLSAHVRSETYHGPLIRYELEAAGIRLTAEAHNRADRGIFPVDSEVTVGWNPDGTALLID